MEKSKPGEVKACALGHMSRVRESMDLASGRSDFIGALNSE